MIFNEDMTIWIFAMLLMVAVSLAGWRQGAIRAAFSFVGILFAALLAAPLGRLIHPLLPHLGVANPITAWAVSPVLGFILASIPFAVAAQYVHNRVEHHFKYKAGDLQLALYARLNTRLGICIGLVNGAAYFILISFLLYNLAYWTTQMTTEATAEPVTVRLVNSLGRDMQSAGFCQTASAVGTLSPNFYRLADLGGLLAQNPQLGTRVANYPGLTSLWHRDDMQPLVTDSALTNALVAATPLHDILNLSSVQGLLANKDLSKTVEDTVLQNLDDLTAYLNTGNTVKYGSEPILGNWTFNAGVTLAWLREAQPKMAAAEMRAFRGLWSQAYAQTTLLLTGDNQLFVWNLPKFVAKPQPNQPPFEPQDWKGEWSREGTNYTLHISANGEDKYLAGSTDGLRLKLKDGHNLFVFDHVEN
jgi:hypothetical protein